MRILILGYGVQGKSAEKICQKEGLDYFVYTDEQKVIPNLQDFNLVVTSSGFDRNHKIHELSKSLGILVINEIFFGLIFKKTKSKVILITGTNGKTTTTQMIDKILNTSGKKSKVSGNIGVGMADTIYIEELDYIVVEVGSIHLNFSDVDKAVQILKLPKYQQAELSVITNIAPDHISWHGTFENYKIAKYRVKDLSKICIEEDSTTLSVPNPGQIGIVEDLVVYRKNKEEATEIFDTNIELKFPINNITLKNIMISSMVCLKLEIDPKYIQDALQDFELDKSRAKIIEIEYKGNKYTFIQDSKGTNPHSTSTLIQSYPKKSIVWITGGVTKGANFNELNEEIKPFVHSIIVITKNINEFKTIFSDTQNVEFIDISKKEQMIKSGILKAIEMSNKGTKLIVFSPATASFDLFDNYIQRGEIFENILEELDESKK